MENPKHKHKFDLKFQNIHQPFQSDVKQIDKKFEPNNFDEFINSQKIQSTEESSGKLTFSNDIIKNKEKRKSVMDVQDSQKIFNDQFMLQSLKKKDKKQKTILGSRFKLKNHILGMGSFGRTYLGYDNKYNKDVAIKIMLKNRSMDSFIREACIFRKLNKLKAFGFPHMLLSSYNDDICVLVMELLGKNLEQLRKIYKKLSLSVVCSIGIQMVNRLQLLHQCGIVHRDIKPQNIVLGMEVEEKENTVHLLDFGMSIQYLTEDDQHIKSDKNYNQMIGTALFASVNAHQGKELSRRDDVESLMYSLMYLLTGTLPWKKLDVKKKKDRHLLIQAMKEELTSNARLQNDMKHVPKEFFQIINYAQSMQFNEEPKYKYIKQLLQKIIKKEYNIQRIQSIDIINNNNENEQKQLFNIEDINVIGIAFQINDNQIAQDDGYSHTINEHLMLYSQIDNKSQLMTTQELQDELAQKLSKENIKQLMKFQINYDHSQFNSQLIIEEDEENEKSHSQSNSITPISPINSRNNLIKNVSSNQLKLKEEEDKQEEEKYNSPRFECESQEEDVPDDEDFEEVDFVQKYSMKFKQNDLKDLGSK